MTHVTHESTLALKSGRIPAETFLISIWTSFSVITVALFGRCAIYCHYGKKPGLDDVFLAVAFFTLLASLIIIQVKCYDAIYITDAAKHNVLLPSKEILDLGLQLRIWSTAALMIDWSTICAVKLSFLFFFKKLIDRIRSLYIYWCIVLTFNVAVFGYGILIYYIGCPNWSTDPRSLISCSKISGLGRTLTHHSFAQICLDIAGDILILFIPAIVVYQIRVSATQKLMLGLSLGLTICCVIFTIVRGAGLTSNGQFDHLWQIYWQVMASQAGVLVASLIAFRSFFVMRNAKRADRKSANSTSHRRFIKVVRKIRGQCTLGDTFASATLNQNGLPSIPRPELTGMQSFIEKEQRDSFEDSISISSKTFLISHLESNTMYMAVLKDASLQIPQSAFPLAKCRDLQMAI